MMKSIGQSIREERKKRGMTQARIAEILGMSRATISQVENGSVQDIGIRKVIRILEILRLEISVRPAGAPPTLDELLRENEAL